MVNHRYYTARAHEVARSQGISISAVIWYHTDPFNRSSFAGPQGAVGRFEYRNKTMWLQRGRPGPETALTMFHELTHAKLGPKVRGQKQVHDVRFYQTMWKMIIEECDDYQVDVLARVSWGRARQVAVKIGLVGRR